MTARCEEDEEIDPLSAVVKWVAIASVLVALTAAVILDDWLLLVSVPVVPVGFYVMHSRSMSLAQFASTRATEPNSPSP